MPMIEIEGVGRVEPDPSFFQLPPEQQAKQVDELIATYKKMQPEQQDPVQAAAAENRANFASSAKNFASNVVQPIIHPIDTAENIGTLGRGILQKTGIIGGKDSIPAADAAWDALVNRYGSADAIKKTIHEDPVGFMADLSLVLTGGGAAAARVGGGVGAAGKIASAVGAASDPISIAGRAAGTVARPIGNLAADAAGITTGAGSQAIKTAYQAGAQGGQSGQAFREGMSGADNAATAVNEAKAALAQMRAERGTAYREGMDKLKTADSALGPENQVLDFGKIDQAVDKVSSVKSYKGQDLSPETQSIREKMTQAIQDWKTLPPTEYHTAEGLDALKQKLGDIRDATDAGTPSRLVADQIYNSVRQTIVDQAPEYAKIMKGYEQASSIIKEIENTLSLKPNANIDTSLRKLQSVLRDNVNTNYGRRAELADFLVRAGAPNLMQRLAGQALSSASPRGLGKAVASGEMLSSLGALALGHPAVAAGLVPGIAASSPALVGGAAYGLGAASRLPGRALGDASFQLGRVGQ